MDTEYEIWLNIGHAEQTVNILSGVGQYWKQDLYIQSWSLGIHGAQTQ